MRGSFIVIFGLLSSFSEIGEKVNWVSLAIHEKPLSTTPDFVNEVTFEKPLRMEVVARGTNQKERVRTSNPTSPNLTAREGWRLNQSQKVNDSVNFARVMKSL